MEPFEQHDVHYRHTKPANAVNETAALHNVVETYKQNSTESDIIVLGDFTQIAVMFQRMNLLISLRSKPRLSLLPDSADTTFSENTHCAYDRIVSSDIEDRFFDDGVLIEI